MDASEAAASEAAPVKRTTRSSRRRSSKRDASTSKDEAPAATPTPSGSQSAGGSATLASAQAALRRGAYAEAYRLAARVKGGGSEAAYVLTVAACGMSDVTKARVALKRLPLLKRGKAKKACKKLGVSL